MIMADNLTVSQRSYCMSRVRNRNTGLERIVCKRLRRRGIRFKTHVRDLPGTPDIVFHKQKVAVFIDGDFWHGYHFPKWESQLPLFWRNKISLNRSRDQCNFRKLRRMGWRVVRVWGHDIEKDLNSCLEHIMAIFQTNI
jgi:DNA mismatch endonuclease (patch repair protein)